MCSNPNWHAKARDGKGKRMEGSPHRRYPSGHQIYPQRSGRSCIPPLQTFPFLLRKNYPEDIPYEISNFRGDSWQIVCSQPQKALEVGLFIRTYLRFTFKHENWIRALPLELAASISSPLKTSLLEMAKPSPFRVTCSTQWNPDAWRLPCLREAILLSPPRLQSL